LRGKDIYFRRASCPINGRIRKEKTTGSGKEKKRGVREKVDIGRLFSAGRRRKFQKGQERGLLGVAGSGAH